MQVYKINENGFFIKDMVIEDGEEAPSDCIEIKPPQGLYRAKWTGVEWVEDMPQEEIKELNKPTKEQEIIRLKKQLEETDYQIIKSSEYQLMGLKIPYNLEELHAERQALRDRINELETL